MKNLVECVVLLRGNFVVMNIAEDGKLELSSILGECVKKSNEDPTMFLKWGDDVVILAKEIVGWYFRLPMVSPTDKILKYMDKKDGEGDNWKGEQ